VGGAWAGAWAGVGGGGGEGPEGGGMSYTVTIMLRQPEGRRKTLAGSRRGSHTKAQLVLRHRATPLLGEVHGASGASTGG
jgi:hypothetical protein